MKYLILSYIFLLVCVVAYGQDSTATVTDIDGNVYRTITIGTQTWMAEDLKVTTLRNGAPITHITGNEAGTLSWEHATTAAYCWYNNNINSSKTYGALYNWAAVSTGVLAPEGWHVPSIDEWRVLIKFLGGEKVAGGKLKEVGTAHWAAPNTGANNSSGFTALPGGGRVMSFDFFAIGHKGWWWSSTKKNLFKSYFVGLSYGQTEIGISKINTSAGFSVRCIKD